MCLRIKKLKQVWLPEHFMAQHKHPYSLILPITFNKSYYDKP